MWQDGAAGQAAELAAHGGTDLDDQREIVTLARAAEELAAGEWWRAAGGPVVRVRSARSSDRSSSARDADGAVEVRLATGQLDLATLAHELAHALAGVDHGHDERFRAANVDIVAVLGGAPAGRALADAYAAFGLAIAARPWPPPSRGSAPGFLIVP